MYLRNALKGGRISSFSKVLNKNFSILDRITRDTLSFRMSKYDPTKELEVKINKIRLITLKCMLILQKKAILQLYWTMELQSLLKNVITLAIFTWEF